MSGKPFDATTKELIQNHPRDWLEYLGLPVVSVTVVDADLSTVSPDADKILVVDVEPPYIAHLELQSAYKPDDAERFMRYNVLAGCIHDLLVRTVVFLLRPEADGPCMRGPLIRQFPDEPEYLHFRFRVVLIPLLYPSYLGRSGNPGNSLSMRFCEAAWACCLSPRCAMYRRVHCRM